MAMQICVLCDSRLDSIDEWQKCIDAEGFPLQLSDADPTRNLGARLRDEETSIEYAVHDFSELKEAYGHVNFGRNWKYSVTFTWASNFADEIAAWMAATAYASGSNGVIFDEHEGKILSLAEARKITSDIERRRSEAEVALRSFKQRLSVES